MKRFITKSLSIITGLCSVMILSQSVIADDNSENIVFSETFDTQESLDNWTIIDNNGGRTWEYLNGTAAYMLDYQTGLPGDDWLISQGFNLESGIIYKLSFTLTVKTDPENCRVCLGTSPNEEGMTTIIADFPSAVSADSGTKTYEISVEESGTYYLGFYSYSEPEMHRWEVDNILIEKVSSDTVPAGVSDLSVIAGENGALSATISFVSPTLSAGGNELSELTEIKIFKGDSENAIHTFESPKVGALLSFTDNECVNDYIEYTVVAYNSSGSSVKATATVFVGSDKTVPVSGLSTLLNSDMSITLSWEAPTSTVNGGYADFSSLKYKILRNGEVLVGQQSETTFTDNRPVEIGQDVVSYEVIAIAGEYESDGTVSGEMHNGTPIDLPYFESFADQSFAGIKWLQDVTCHAFDWEITFDDSDGEFEEIVSQDKDNGMLVAKSRYAYYDEQSRFISPIFNLASVANPILSFWFYYGRSPWYDPEWDGNINDNLQIQVSVDGGEWVNLENAQFYQNENGNGWVKCEVSLPRYEGYSVRIGLLATAQSDGYAYKSIYVDNITIDESAYAKDLSVNGFSVDKKRIDVGEKMFFALSLFNRGSETVSTGDYKVELYCNDEVVEVLDGVEIEPASTEEIKFEIETSLKDYLVDEYIYYAAINYSEDECADNNFTEEISTSVRRPEMPIVTSLVAESENSQVLISWDAATSVPVTEKGSPITVTDDFESYDSFLIEDFGEWSVYDGDKAPTLSSPRIPNDYENRGEPMAFQVFNIVDAGCWVEDNYDDAFRTMSGDQMIVCPSVDYPYENDDWLITPRLDGRSHTISFYAKAATYDSEWINVYYSTTDNHHDSFIKLNEEDRIYVRDVWQQYSYEVPDEARYFAIRCIRRCVFLFIDDFKYNAHDGSADPVNFLGYNIYRDGNKLNDELLAENSYIDADVIADESYKYSVTAVYEEGESAFSEEVLVAVSGINSIKTDVMISVEDNLLNVSSKESVELKIYSLDGRIVWAGLAEGETAITLNNGAYIVKIGNRIHKIVI